MFYIETWAVIDSGDNYRRENKKLMQKIFRVLANVGLAGFLIWSALLVIIYFGDFTPDKIVRPQYKNMNSREVIYFGLLCNCVYNIGHFDNKAIYKTTETKQRPPNKPYKTNAVL